MKGGLVALLLCVPGMLPGADAWAAAAGRFQFVVGDVRVLPANGGDAVIVRRGAEVQPGDTVITAARGIAQLRMVDGAQLAVRPSTELRIDEYRFEQPAQQDRSFFSLLSGAFRSVTGLIGQRNNDAYQVTTSTATIGIRGSDADIGHNAVSQLTAVRTYDGAHALTARGQTGPGATLLTGPGDIAVVLPGSLPRFAAEFPFQTTPVAPADGDGEEAAGGDEAEAGGEGDDVADAGDAADTGDARASGDTGDSLGPPPPPVQTIVSGEAPSLAAVRLAPAGSVLTGAYIAPDAGGFLEGTGGFVLIDNVDSFALLGGNYEVLLTVATDDFGTFAFAAGTAVLRQSGTTAITGAGGAVAANASWGLWQGDFFLTDDDFEPDIAGGFPFAVSNRPTSPTEIAAMGGTSFTYTRVGGAVTNEAGAAPTSFALAASGTFGPGPGLGTIAITGTANFAAGSTGWAMGGSGSIADMLDDDIGISLGGTCTGCSSPSGEAGGQLLGARAEGLILGFGLADPSSGKGIAGTGVLQRVP